LKYHFPVPFNVAPLHYYRNKKQTIARKKSKKVFLKLKAFSINANTYPTDGIPMLNICVKAETRERDIAMPPSVQPSVRFLRENASRYMSTSKGENMPLHLTTFIISIVLL
jgi:hypothetical protein